MPRRNLDLVFNKPWAAPKTHVALVPIFASAPRQTWG
jgi:hypothetical protein